MNEPLFVSSSPVFSVDGEDRGELARDLVFLQVEESVSGLKNLQARFVAIGARGRGEREELLYMDGEILDFGKALQVAIGPLSNQRTIFDGHITALEIHFEEAQEPELCVYAEDRLMDLRMTRRIRTYEEMSDADIASAIASEHGMTPEVDVSGPTHDRIQQLNMSDLAFLRERARLLQAEVWADGDTLHFKTRDRRQAAAQTLVRGNEIITLSACADLAHQRTQVHVSGYDANRREVIDESVGEEAIQAEITSGRSGPAVLQQAFGERIERRLRETPLESSEASEWARAEMLRRARQFVVINGITSGSPDMTVGSALTLERVGPVFEGEGYYVTHLKHTFDLAQGHRTHFEAERATVGD
ncbi:phage late control D family protein [Pseudomaricurvus alcaniphilus]|uniref:phage late control D family protein n=1 Tax=Pseudomaricurvus alcaniphilus TaxID=1166482 RepID=UPI001408B866|nr:contractile injection system protein, VgrG/Pvc8 family [Pseudomaricurvus alcaniphilus]NHN38327.1 phage late control D family protein [Pseudomaricurvus alcaniphilus]